MLPFDSLAFFFLLLFSAIVARSELRHEADAQWIAARSSSDELCPAGMNISVHFPLLGWCYGLATTNKMKHSFEDAVQLCSSTFNGSVPSVNSFEENQALLSLLYEPEYGNTWCWIGLKCGMDGKWLWLNGETFVNYTHFDESMEEVSERCDPDSVKNFHVSYTGRWVAGDPNPYPYQVCTKRPDEFDPSDYPAFTIQHESCDPGWTLIDGICYKVDNKTRRFWTWDQANAACENMNATLPIILFDNQNDRLYWLVKSYLSIPPIAQFWIGLVCDDNDNFTWLDGSEYSYNNLPGEEEDAGCLGPNYGVTYAPSEYWDSTAKTSFAKFLVCSRYATLPPITLSSRPQLYSTTRSAETTTKTAVSHAASTTTTLPASTSNADAIHRLSSVALLTISMIFVGS